MGADRGSDAFQSWPPNSVLIAFPRFYPAPPQRQMHLLRVQMQTCKQQETARPVCLPLAWPETTPPSALPIPTCVLSWLLVYSRKSQRTDRPAVLALHLVSFFFFLTLGSSRGLTFLSPPVTLVVGGGGVPARPCPLQLHGLRLGWSPVSGWGQSNLSC